MSAKSDSQRRRAAARIRPAGGGPDSPARGGEQLRYHLSQEAARIMAEEGVRDYHAAKCKAAVRLNQAEARNLPSNREVEDALRYY